LAFHTIIATARNPFRGEIVKGLDRQILTFLRFGPAHQPFCERTDMAVVGGFRDRDQSDWPNLEGLSRAIHKGNAAEEKHSGKTGK
jgi:hypothetical protein